MAFADPPNGRIAGHLPERLDSVGKQKRLRAGARGREGRLRAGMPSAYNYHVKFARKVHDCLSAPTKTKGEFYGKSLLKGEDLFHVEQIV